MTTKSIGTDYKPIRGADGRIRLVEDRKAKEARLDVSTRIQKRKSKKVTVVKRGAK